MVNEKSDLPDNTTWKSRALVAGVGTLIIAILSPIVSIITGAAEIIPLMSGVVLVLMIIAAVAVYKDWQYMRSEGYSWSLGPVYIIGVLFLPFLLAPVYYFHRPNPEQIASRAQAQQSQQSEQEQSGSTSSEDEFYKRSCNVCGNIWFSPTDKEEDLDASTFSDVARVAGILSSKKSGTQWATMSANQQKRESMKLEDLRTCDECNSKDYNETTVQREEMRNEIKKSKRSNTGEDVEFDPIEELQVKLIEGEIDEEEYERKKQVLEE